MVKALLVYENGDYQSVVYDNFKDLQNFVDGWIEVVQTSKFSAYVDEEGKLKNKQVNLFATKIWHEELKKDGFKTNDFLVGKVVFTGTVDTEGNDTDIDPVVKENIIQRISTLMNEINGNLLPF